MLALLLLACGGPSDENDLALCTDRADNDEDGLVDCMEPSCIPYCQGTPTGDTGTGGDTSTRETGTVLTTADTSPIDTGITVVLSGVVQSEETLSVLDYEVELLGSGLPPVRTDGFGQWSIEAPPGTYPWRVTPPAGLLVPTTGTELTIGTAPEQQFDVILPGFPVATPLPVVGAQVATGLILTVDSVTPESEYVQATSSATPVPIEGVDVLLMYHLAPFGAAGEVGLQFIFPYDPDLELWALDPVTGRWQSFGGFVDLGANRVAPSQNLPWFSTLAIVEP